MSLSLVTFVTNCQSVVLFYYNMENVQDMAKIADLGRKIQGKVVFQSILTNGNKVVRIYGLLSGYFCGRLISVKLFKLFMSSHHLHVLILLGIPIYFLLFGATASSNSADNKMQPAPMLGKTSNTSLKILFGGGGMVSPKFVNKFILNASACLWWHSFNVLCP